MTEKIIQISSGGIDQLFALTESGVVYVFNQGHWNKISYIPKEELSSSIGIEDIAL